MNYWMIIVCLHSAQAEELLTASKPDKEYLPITGLSDFTKNAAKLAYGAESKPLADNAVSQLPQFNSLRLSSRRFAGCGHAIYLWHWCS